tara:strand:- start:47904 stop:49280 length:1377 start_codon:yes stop_codon:yes gene_type:complete
MLQVLAAYSLSRHSTNAQTLHHKSPKILSPNAMTHDWGAFLGPNHNGISSETHLSRILPPPLVWERQKGAGYTSPAIAGTRLILLHREDEKEVIDCLNAETGAPLWSHSYQTNFEDRYGYNNGPRSSPIIDIEGTGHVYTVSAEGLINCLTLEAGEIVWTTDLRSKFQVSQDFFGIASTPLIDEDLLVVNVGAPQGPCVVGFNTKTGEEVWRAGSKWGASYASPVPAMIHNRRRILVFAGGESNPPAGGLMSIDPKTGQLDFEFPFRSRTYESANASSPVVFNNRVFVTSCYRTGSALIEIQPDFTFRLVWTTNEVGLHFNTPIYIEGYLYGFDGRNPGDASLVCLDAETGKIAWRETPEWREEVNQNGRQQTQLMSTFRGSLLQADGHFLGLGELGHLLWMDLTPAGYKEISRTWLIGARESWTLPVISRGLLYVVQNTRDVFNQTMPRLLCYDLRA